MNRRTLEWAALAASLALLASPALAYALGAWDPYWVAVTNLGDEPAYVALSILLYTLVSHELGFYALLSLMTSGWTNVLLKNALALPRPPRELWKIEVSGYGFPSGHAQTSTSFWSSIALKLRDAYAAALGAVIVALVSYSRLELMVHYPHDVAGGILLGLASTLAAFQMIRASEKWERWKQSLFLAAYGAAVSLLYLLHLDVVYARVGGVTIGLSAYPMVRQKIPEKPPLPAKAAAAVVALLAALIITRAVSAAAPLVQLTGYALVAAVAVLAPLAGAPLSRGKTGRA
ncbi:MAG: phosphatase PAP2 family protein [Thermofilaceae archaeon]